MKCWTAREGLEKRKDINFSFQKWDVSPESQFPFPFIFPTFLKRDSPSESVVRSLLDMTGGEESCETDNAIHSATFIDGPGRELLKTTQSFLTAADQPPASQYNMIWSDLMWGDLVFNNNHPASDTDKESQTGESLHSSGERKMTEKYKESVIVST